MTPFYTDDSVTLYHGDCLDILRELPDNLVDSVVTDPPYGLGFMGREWDDLPPGIEFAAECLRVLKPGGHLLAFGGSRTWHRLACAVEDAGFEIRDSIAWLYGSGFPKSLNVAAAVERHRAAGPTIVRSPDDFGLDLLPDEAAFCAWMRKHSGLTADSARRLLGSDRFITGEVQIVNTSTADNPRWGRRAMVPTVAAWLKIRSALAEEPPAWVEALVKSPPRPNGNTPGDEWTPGKGRGVNGDNEWQGWGTALKPAFEPIVVGRKPLAGTVAANVLAHGTGALNVDGCRVEAQGRPLIVSKSEPSTGILGDGLNGSSNGGTTDQGRWPSNVVLDESQAAALDAQSGTSTSNVRPPTGRDTRGIPNTDSQMVMRIEDTTERGHSDSGGASRFFPTFKYEPKAPTTERPRDGVTSHPTVKPLDLMRWLVRLVTPPGGTVLEPFAGSGTTAEACVVEGFKCIAIERESDYLPLIVQRLTKPIQVALDFD